MSEYAVVKSFLLCISSSFAFSVSSGNERARHLEIILENVRQAIEHNGLSPTTQNLLHKVLELLRRFEAEAIDSTELDFLIDGAARDNWSGGEDCGIRVFVQKPSVLMALVMSYNLVLLSQHLVTAAESAPQPPTHSVREQKSTAEKATQAKEPGVTVHTYTSQHRDRTRNLLTARSLIIHHRQLISEYEPSTRLDSIVRFENGTKVTYSRNEILECNSSLFPMPDFTESVFLMGIVKPPFYMMTPPTTPTSPDIPLLPPQPTEN